MFLVSPNPHPHIGSARGRGNEVDGERESKSVLTFFFLSFFLSFFGGVVARWQLPSTFSIPATAVGRAFCERILLVSQKQPSRSFFFFLIIIISLSPVLSIYLSICVASHSVLRRSLLSASHLSRFPEDISICVSCVFEVSLIPELVAFVYRFPIRELPM